MTEKEIVLGDALVSARLSIGFERLKLFFTGNRIIVAHIGKRGVGSLGITSFFGRLSGAVEHVVKGGREAVGKRKLRGSVPEEILASDKDNFFVNYVDVVEVTFDRRFVRPRITVVTRDEKLEFIVTRASEDLHELLERVLEEKVRMI